MSGKQLFLVDNFRDTGRPLLAILADPKSTFVRGLKRFKRRALYANVMNDRTAPYFTTGLATTDPFSEPDKIQLNYTEGYDRVILDRRDPVRTNLQPQKLSVKDKTSRFVKSLPFYATLSVLVPVGIVVFLGNSVVQTYHSSQRIKLHESGKAGIDLTKYRPPFFDEIREAVDEVREAAEDVYENINNAQDQEYLTSDSEDATSIGATSAKGVKKEASHPHHTLALTDEQFAIIEALDNVGFHKNLVRFHNTTHSHAAIVVRVDADHYEEGYQVMRHWLDNEFILE